MTVSASTLDFNLSAMKNHQSGQTWKFLAALFFLAVLPGAAFAVPIISVTSGSGAFGNVAINTTADQTFTITNTGDAAATIDSVVVSGTGYTLLQGATPSSVSASTGTATFKVRFSPTVRQAYSGAGSNVVVTSAGSTNSPITVPLTGTGIASEIGLSQGGTTLSNGSAASTATTFAPVTLNGAPNTATSALTFTINNTGNTTLTLTGGTKVVVGGTNAADFTVTTAPAATVASSGGTTTFTVTFKPSGRGTRTASLSIANDDPDVDKSPFVVNVQGVGEAPEIGLEQPAGSELPVVGSYDGEKSFGNVVTGSNSKLTFTITNTGNVPLTGVSITPTTSGDFSVTSPPPTSVAAGSSATFAVDFIPSSAGAKSAVFNIANNDPDGGESPFVLSLTGTGTAPPTGSDGFGYTYTTAPPTALTLKDTDPDVVNAAALSGDDLYLNLNIGFTFNFYDNAYTTCAASTNGLIMFGTPSADYTPDVPLPNANAPNNIVSPFWVDLYRGSTSKILYATRGSAPNRVFIIEYIDMEEYGNAGGKASFQVQLYEGTNVVEFQFKRYSGFQTPAKAIGIGIENATGLVGINIDKSTLGSLPYGLRFTRPTVVDVESKYTRTDGTVHDIGDLQRGLSPEIGTFKYPYGSLKRFEAPPYIYLDQGFGILNEAGDVNGDSTKLAWYRLVNRGYSIDGQQAQGTDAFVELSLVRDFKIVWRWELEFAVNVKFVGVGSPTPEIGRHWHALNSPLTASVDALITSDALGVRTKTTGYKITTYGPTGPISPAISYTASEQGSRVASIPLTITAPLLFEWLTSGQVRYRFSAASGVDGQTSATFDSMSFVQVYDTDGLNPVTTYGIGAQTDVWINTDPDKLTPVRVGAFYRTAPDNSYTLVDFPLSPGGDLSGVGADISRMDDSYIPAKPALDARLARTYLLNGGLLATRKSPTPTVINWAYKPTIYRAEVPIGMAFDPTKTVPLLYDGVTVRELSDEGPSAATFAQVGDVLAGKKSAGQPLRWDQVDSKLYPVHPDSHQLSWVDKNDRTKSYMIEIVSGYPAQTVNLTSEREDLDGLRQLSGSPPSANFLSKYVMTATQLTIAVTNPGVGFPAQADNAHYRHLFDPSSDRRPPTKLDLSATDEWKFQDMTYTDNGTDASASIAVPGVSFTAQAEGRSVVLYSYRPNPDEVADGSLSKEKLAVRVIRSSPIVPIQADDAKLVLGRRGLELGGGSAANRGAFGVVASSGTSTVDPGTSFMVDFWLNAKGVKDIPVTLTNCTTNGTVNVTCASTTGLVAGMGIAGANIATGTRIASITNDTSFVLDTDATDSGTAITLTASGKPVTVLTTKNGNLKVVLDPTQSTITATYFGVPVTKVYSTAGAAWRHHVIHVFANQVSNGPQATVMDYYVDGVRDEIGFVTTEQKSLTDTATFDVGTSLTANSLRFGVDADPQSQIQMDQFRLFTNLPLVSSPATPTDPWLSETDVLALRTTRNMASSLRASLPALWFSFDTYPNGGTSGLSSAPFANSGSLSGVTVGPVTADGTGVYAGTLAHVDIQEVATRIESPLDNAGFSGTGYVLNKVSNYNAVIYNRTAEVGSWGTLFPVNHTQLYTDATKRLEVAYYENPYRTNHVSHPNVAWPYTAQAFNEIKYPAFGPHKDKAIYIASRIGSEGVDQKGRVQPAFYLDRYSNLTIYNQPDKTLPGYNPNEEHALVAASGRAGLKLKNFGEDIPNDPPLAAFALQSELNAKSPSYSSDPWVLAQVNNLLTGEPEMAAYQVFKTRSGSIDFPRPLDATVSATAGLAYEPAATPEDRFLTTDVTKTFNFKYQFSYTAFAGDLLIPPYPLNLVIGNVAMADARGKSIQVNSVNQRVLWRDVNKNAWVVSGNGKFFHQYFYPFRADFFMPTTTPVGTPVAWVPDTGTNFTGSGLSLDPVKVVYDTFWRADYPKLKRGETLTYQGGEYFNETPGSNGLPALVAMKAAEIVYDSSIPSMVMGAATANRYELANASARIVRALDRREKPFTVANMGLSGFTPATNTKIFIVAERWYFKELPGSLQKRFYFDSLAEKLVFRGYLNDKDSGNKDLTVGPDPLNILEPNVMTKDDYNRLRALAGTTVWTTVIDQMYLLAQNPHVVTSGNTSASAAINNLQGVKDKPTNYSADLTQFWLPNLSGAATSPVPTIVPLDSFGVGSALVPNADLLTKAPTGSLYITIAENNRSELVGAPVSLHIVEIIPDRYRGAIKVIEAADAFSEKISLQHNGEFGGNTGDLYYEWWIRDAGSLDEVALEVLANGTLKPFDTSGNTLWQEYLPKDRLENASLSVAEKHLGLNSIVFEGRPDVVLADKLVLMRYRHKNEANWTLVPFEVANRTTAWKPGSVSPVSPAPFQWAGAANSPQLQADGSRRYVPQLVMGWVKRVLDRINPYEARYTDFFSNESPATYSSQLQIAGGPYAGNVALNPDKNVIENTGLIELYMTVLNRAMSLSIDNSSNGVASDGIKQALLLAATRLSVLYELLAREAYSDAQDSTINSGEDGGLLGIASYTHAFQNMEANLMHEELALLRGTDFLKSYPVYNRMFWNYAKGLGEAAYNVNYNIYDVNTDGFINEDDARKLYPQGHGDAWGHFLSALGMHYTLLQHPGFSWKSRSELYSLMQNVLEVDFLDEKTFARLAAGKARAGRDIVRDTYRMSYTQDPDGQWQGYTDGADPARAWGVSEWAHRAGQGAWFDCAVANALLPEVAPGANPENLDLIDRQSAIDDIGEIAGGLHEIQVAMDEANGGVNPLGFDSDALTFDIEYQFVDNLVTSHFEQVLSRAVDAGSNALATLEYATQAGNKLRAIADDTDALVGEAMSQDLDFRNRLIELFGRPYDGTIGFGKAYPEGYEGPDTLLFAYLDKIKIEQIVPPIDSSATVNFNVLLNQVRGPGSVMDNAELVRLYGHTNGNQKTLAFQTFLRQRTDWQFGAQLGNLSLPYKTASRYGFEAPSTWGQRTSYGSIQGALMDMLSDEIELDSAINDYIAFLGDFEQKIHRLQNELAINAEKEGVKDAITGVRAGINSAMAAFDVIKGAAELIKGPVKTTAAAIEAGLPTSLGFSNDVTSVGRGVAAALSVASEEAFDGVAIAGDIGKTILGLVRDEVIERLNRDIENRDEIRELEGILEELEGMTGADIPKRDAIGAVLQSMEIHRQAYVTAQAAGFRLLKERESFNKNLASRVQKNRYQDMIFRLTRNEAMSKYQSSFNNAARYAWLAARAYDYETSLDPGHPAAPGALLDKIVRERQLGLWVDGAPQLGSGGLAEILAQLNGNFAVLKRQLGIVNPQSEVEQFSLRKELFRINSLDPALQEALDLKDELDGLGIPDNQRTLPQLQILARLNVPENQDAISQAAASDARWTDALKARFVSDLNTMPQFVRYCRPFASGKQPGLVIRFGSSIESEKNFFGLQLATGDHSYSTANYATKILGFGISLEGYDGAELAYAPRAYMVPIGNDYMRTSTSPQPITRMWNVVEQRIPTPFTINLSKLSSPNYIPSLNGVDGAFGELRRFGDMVMYHDAEESEMIMDSRLISRSVWNSEWMLVIPGAGLLADPEEGLKQFAEHVSDIKISIQTYSHQGQ